MSQWIIWCICNLRSLSNYVLIIANMSKGLRWPISLKLIYYGKICCSMDSKELLGQTESTFCNLSLHFSYKGRLRMSVKMLWNYSWTPVKFFGANQIVCLQQSLEFSVNSISPHHCNAIGKLCTAGERFFCMLFISIFFRYISSPHLSDSIHTIANLKLTSEEFQAFY